MAVSFWIVYANLQECFPCRKKKGVVLNYPGTESQECSAVQQLCACTVLARGWYFLRCSLCFPPLRQLRALSLGELSGGSSLSPRDVGQFSGSACASGMVAVLIVLILDPEHKDGFTFAFLKAIRILQHKYMFPELSRDKYFKNVYNCQVKCVLVFAAFSLSASSSHGTSELISV